MWLIQRINIYMILVLATPRSGSSWFTSTYLIHGSPDLEPVYPGYVHVGEAFNCCTHSREEQIAALRGMINGGHSVVKLFPQDLYTAKANTYNTVVTVAEKIYVLVRKDFDAQLRSLYVAVQTDYCYGDDLPTRSIQYNADSYNHCAEFLQTSLKILAQQWRGIDAVELVYLEDLPRSGKYSQPVTWDQEPPRVDFNTELLFTQCARSTTHSDIQGNFDWMQ